MPMIIYLVGLFVGAVFLFSGLDKARSGGAEAGVARYEILPDGLVRPVGLLLPMVEVLVGSALLTGLLARAALVMGAMMLGAFALAVVVNLRRGRDIDCGCRSESKPISWALAIQDSVLAVVCIIAATQPSTGPWQAFTGRGAIGASDAVALTISATLAWVLVQLVISARSVRRTLQSLVGPA